jgi:hypothetical protein
MVLGRVVVTDRAPSTRFAVELGVRGWWYRRFVIEYREVSRRVLGEEVSLSEKQFKNWVHGRVRTRPYPGAAKVLEVMFPPWSVTELLAAPTDEPAPAPVVGEGVAERRTARGEQAADDELASHELWRRASVSEVGSQTLDVLEVAFDDLAVAYPTTSPEELLVRLRQYLGYVGDLMELRSTLDSRRRLLVVGGWLSLLTATVHIDLVQPSAAAATLRTADGLAGEAGHDEIRAWCLETRAWQALTDGDHRRAVDLARGAQAVAPAGSSVAVQAVAQEGRAWARLRQPQQTGRAVARVDELVGRLRPVERPEHHYRYDPQKSVAIKATTLAWAGDPAAEGLAREVISDLGRGAQAGKWPRRLASAHLDLAVSLLTTNQPDEACSSALAAVLSGRIAPSNHWRVAEVVTGVRSRGLPEASDLMAAYRDMMPGGGRPASG